MHLHKRSFKMHHKPKHEKQTINLLEENLEMYLHSLGISKILLTGPQKELAIFFLHKFDFTKTKIFCSLKDSHTPGEVICNTYVKKKTPLIIVGHNEYYLE